MELDALLEALALHRGVSPLALEVYSYWPREASDEVGRAIAEWMVSQGVADWNREIPEALWPVEMHILMAMQSIDLQTAERCARALQERAPGHPRVFELQLRVDRLRQESEKRRIEYARWRESLFPVFTPRILDASEFCDRWHAPPMLVRCPHEAWSGAAIAQSAKDFLAEAGLPTKTKSGFELFVRAGSIDPQPDEDASDLFVLGDEGVDVPARLCVQQDGSVSMVVEGNRSKLASSVAAFATKLLVTRAWVEARRTHEWPPVEFEEVLDDLLAAIDPDEASPSASRLQREHLVGFWEQFD